MGNDESTPRNEQRNNRNVSKAEVERALEKQRRLYEQRMQEVLRNQAATNLPPQSTSFSNSAGSSHRVAPPRPPAPATAPTPVPRIIETQNANYLERQRSPYSFNQNNLRESTAQFNSSRPLYPNLNDNGNASVSPGNNNSAQRQSSVGTNEFVFVNGPARYSPSAPPAPSYPQRDSSASRSRSTPEDNDITCPTCKNRFGLKIFNCASGHASCLECKLSDRHCGLCGASVTDRRNITMEEYVSERKVPCLNADEGCSLSFKLCEMDQHLKECPFKETQCLLPGGMCRWKGKLSRMATHFDNFHPTHRGNVDTEMFLQLHNMCNTKRMQLINIGNFNFVFFLIVSEMENKIYIAVQLLGTKISAAKWNYEIHVYNKGEPRRKYQYIDKCFSSGESVEDIVSNNSCAVLPLQYAKSFINNGAVAYKLFIKKEEYTSRLSSLSSREEPKRDVSRTRRGGRGGRGRGRGRWGNREFEMI